MWEQFIGVDLLPDYSAFCREKLQNHWIFGLCLKHIAGIFGCLYFWVYLTTYYHLLDSEILQIIEHYQIRPSAYAY